MTSGYSTITQKGQITLPADIRKHLGLNPGKRVVLTREGETVRVHSAGDFYAMAGSLASKKPFSVRNMRRSAKKLLVRRHEKTA